MASSSPKTVDQFKSPQRVVTQILLRSRENQKKRATRKGRTIDELRRENQQLRRSNLELQAQLEHSQMQQAQTQVQMRKMQNAPVQLPIDPPLPHHTYGPRIISLAINLACAVGLRAAQRVMAICFDWLEVKGSIPEWTSIRTWLCRYGVGLLEEPIERAEDWILMADHSNQIGTDKVLVILGIRACDLPPIGRPLRYSDMRVLAVVPGSDWKREDVAKQYELLATRIGTPMAIVTDGAVELRESVSGLENTGKIVMMFRDFKHVAANEFKHQLEKDPQFSKFMTQLGQCRCAIQQTDLGHFNPPSPKTKARFMNLEAILHWAEMVLWQLSRPRSKGRRGIEAKRVNKKLGWLRSFRLDIERWMRCQAVISKSLGVINEEGLYRGSGENLAAALSFMGGCEASDQMILKLVNFVSESEQQLKEGIRVPGSTEILESSFGQFKLLEGQHSKGGFTSLIAAFPALLSECTAASVKETLTRVSVKDMKEWTTKKLGQTLNSRRQEAYAEFAAAK